MNSVRGWIVGVLLAVAVPIAAVGASQAIEKLRARHVVAPRASVERPVAVDVAAAKLRQIAFAEMRRQQDDPGAVDNAISVFESVLAKDPEDLRAKFGLAWAYQIQGMREADARRLYDETAEEAVRLAALSLYNEATMHQQKGEHAKALDLFERALRIDPSHFPSAFNAGFAHDALGDPAHAAEAFRRAVRIAPEHVASHFQLGVEYAKLGRRADAERAWATALRLDPSLRDRVEAARRAH